jgi:hypothetical protein
MRRLAQRLLECDQRAVAIVPVAQQVAEVRPGIGVAGLHPDRLAIRGFGRVRMTQACLQDAQQRARIRAQRQRIDGGAGQGQRLCVAALQEQRVRTAQNGVGASERGPGRGRGTVHARRVAAPGRRETPKRRPVRRLLRAA